jgi:hypothetical protein
MILSVCDQQRDYEQNQNISFLISKTKGDPPPKISGQNRYQI